MPRSAKTMGRAIAVAVVALLVLAGSGRAAAPITLTTAGEDPQLAVDGSGNAHIVWTTNPGGAADTITYCEIPDGANRCAITHTFTAGLAVVDEYAHVVLGPAAGEIVVSADTGGYFQTFQGDGVAVWVSMDGGKTFSAGAEGGGFVHPDGFTFPSFSLGSTAAFGPGGFSVSLLDGDGFYEDVPINAGPPPGTAAVPANTEDTELFADRCGGYANTSVAMVNSTTPIAACSAGTPGHATALEYRIATGAGDIDDASTGSWGATRSFPVSSNSPNLNNLVGGPRGVYANYNSPADTLDVRHLTGTSFGPATTIAPHARPFQLAQDTTGNLYVAYFHNIDTGDPLDVSTSADGTTWTRVPLATPGLTFPPTGAQVGGCAAATATQSGNGWVIWEQGPADPNSTVRVESFGDSPCGGDQGSAACPTQLTVGIAKLVTSDGCFAKQPDGRYTASGEAELNGMTIDPAGGASDDDVARTASLGKLIIDTADRTLSSTGPVSVAASNIKLAHQAINWLLPSSDGTITDLAGRYAKAVGFDPSSLGSHVLGFDINGLVTPILQAGGEASLAVNAVMPSPIGGFIGSVAPTDDLKLLTSNAIPGGLSLSPGSVHINIPDVSLGIAELKPFDLDYDSDPEVFDGHIDLMLPVLDNGLDTHFRFEQGRFVEGDADLNLGSDFQLFPDVFLQHIDLKVTGRHGNPCAVPATAADGPTSIGGGMTVSLGPITDGTAVYALQGDASYTFPEASCDQPGVFAVTGAGQLFGVSVSNAHASFTTDGNISLGGGVSFGNTTLGLSSDLEGEIQAHSPYAFYAKGDSNVYVGGLAFGPTVVASSIGIGACLSPVGYVEYRWRGSLSGGLLGCDLGDLTPMGLDPDARGAAQPPAITVPRRERAEELVVTGSGGAPQVTLTGPHGVTVTTPTLAAGQTAVLARSARADTVVSEPLDQTAIRLDHPAAGQWRITVLPGSPAIVGVSVAHALPEVAVTAKVRAGSSRRRTISYTNTPAPGRVVTLIETGAGAVAHPLGRITGAGGEIRFTPETGPAGRREILAEVTERGVSVGAPLRVATYLAPGPPKLARPGHLTVKRRGHRIVIAWVRVPGADRYVVRAMLTDGRALLRLVPHATRSVTVSDVSGDDAGKIMVAALDPVNHPGAVATAKLAAERPTCRNPRARHGKLICAARRQRHH